MPTFGTRILTDPVSQWLNPTNFINSWPDRVESTLPKLVTADVSTHTKGAWVEMIASTSAEANIILLSIINFTSNIGTQSLADIGVGPAGSEVVVVANANAGQLGLSAGTTAGAAGYRPDQLFPVNIPAGSRVAVRIQSAVTSRTADVSICLLDVQPKNPSSLVTIGADTSLSRGTNLPTNDTYVELVASTTQTFRGVVMVPLSAGTGVAGERSIYTLGIGASGSEVELGTMEVASNAAEITALFWAQMPFVYYGNIPTGSRLAVKQSVGRNYRDVILYGIPF
jgi:hypothetical protein